MRTKYLILLAFLVAFALSEIVSQEQQQGPSPSGSLFIKSIGTQGKLDGQFNHPVGVTHNDTHIFVTDIDNHRIQIFTKSGDFVQTFGSYGGGKGELNHPYGIALFHKKGYIVVTEYSNHRITVFQGDGEPLGSFGGYGKDEGKLHNPTGIAVDKDGRVIVADANNNRIQFFTINGKFIRLYRGTQEEPFLYPSDISLNRKGDLFVLETYNHRFHFLGLDGNIKKFGTSGSLSMQFQHPRGIVSNGRQILVSDTQNHRIQIIRFDSQWNASTTVLGSYGSENWQFNQPQGIDVIRRDGVIIVADTNNHRLVFMRLPEESRDISPKDLPKIDSIL